MRKTINGLCAEKTHWIGFIRDFSGCCVGNGLKSIRKIIPTYRHKIMVVCSSAKSEGGKKYMNQGYIFPKRLAELVNGLSVERQKTGIKIPFLNMNSCIYHVLKWKMLRGKAGLGANEKMKCLEYLTLMGMSQ